MPTQRGAIAYAPRCVFCVTLVRSSGRAFQISFRLRFPTLGISLWSIPNPSFPCIPAGGKDYIYKV